MSENFVEWQGRLLGTFHTSPNGIPTNVLDIRALNADVTMIYYSHPHLHKSGGSRHISIAARPVDVYKWLKVYKHVNVPDTLVARVEALDEGVLTGLLYAAQAELGRDDIRLIRAFHIEPWYFADIGDAPEKKNPILFFPANQTGKTRQLNYGQENITHRLTINSAGIKLLGKMGNPATFAEINHDELFEYLQQIRAVHLARLWLWRPDYFSVLKSFDPIRWNTLHVIAQKGLLDVGKENP